MPPLLRLRIAVVAMVGVLLIPVVQSSLRGATHVLTCREEVEAPFQVVLQGEGAVLTGATVLTPGEPDTLCGGLGVDLSVELLGEGRVAVPVSIRNETGADWRGTVQLKVGGTRVPVDLGRVGAGETVVRTVELQVPEGAVELDGSLLVGP